MDAGLELELLKAGNDPERRARVVQDRRRSVCAGIAEWADLMLEELDKREAAGLGKVAECSCGRVRSRPESRL